MRDKFDFRLQKVLQYREKKEKAAQSKLADAQSSLQNSLTQLSDLKNELLEVYSQQKKETVREFNVEDYLLCSRYADYLTGCITNTQQEVQQKEEEVHEERRQLEAKMLERKILSNLKDKQYLAFQKAGNLEEQKINDEIIITSHSRK